MIDQTIGEKLDTLTIKQKTFLENQKESITPLTNNIQCKKKVPAFTKTDEYGFILHPEEWNKGIAQALAQREVEGDLTENHWRIIDYLRHYYLEFRVVPPVRLLERGSGLSLQHIYKLFPNGLGTGVCRISGIDREAAMVYSIAGCS